MWYLEGQPVLEVFGQSEPPSCSSGDQFSAQKQGGLAGRPRPSPGVPVRAEPQWVSAESASEAVDDVLEKPMSYSYEYQGENAWPGHESCRITRAPQVPSTK